MTLRLRLVQGYAHCIGHLTNKAFDRIDWLINWLYLNWFACKRLTVTEASKIMSYCRSKLISISAKKNFVFE